MSAPARSPSGAEVAVAVVGGGVAGRSAARALALRGARVTLFDAAPAAEAAEADGTAAGSLGDGRRGDGRLGDGRLGDGGRADAGASSLPVALLNPWRGRKGAAHPDDLRGLAVVWRWADALAAEGHPPGAHRSGVLRLAGSARQARAWRRRVEAEAAPGTPAPLAWLDPRALGAPYHAPHGAVLVRGGGWIEPRRWLRALLASAVAHGAEAVADTAIASVERRAGGAWTLRDAVGAVVGTAGTVLLCVGADAAPRVVDGGATIAAPTLVRTRGDVARMQGTVALPRPVAGGIYAASTADGATWVGGGHRPPDEPDASAAANLRASFAWSVPALLEAPVTAVWSGVRAKTADGRPRVEERAPGVWWFGAFAGRGFLCAADEAERLAARIAPDGGTPGREG